MSTKTDSAPAVPGKEEAGAGTAAAPYPNPVYSWFVVGILVLVAIVSYIDRQVVAIVVDPMQTDLGIGDALTGLLYSIFAIFYAVAGLPLAWLADRYSRKHLIAAGVFFWSLMTMACGLSKNFWHILIARIGVGVGEASLTPATNSMVGDYFPRERIPLALSIFQTGAIMGSGIAFVIGGAALDLAESYPLSLPVVGDLAPWQQTFLYVGAPGLLLAVVMLMIKEPVRRYVISATDASGNPAAPMKELLTFYRENLGTFVFHHLGFLFLALSGYAFVFWSVTFFTRVHGMDSAEASQIFGLIFLIAGPFGVVWAAIQARWFERRGMRDGNIVAAMLGGFLSIPVVLAIQVMPNATWAFVLYAPAMFFVNSPFGLAYGALPVITPPQMRAQIAAVYMFVVSLGMLLGPTVAGVFNEQIFPGPDGVRYSLMTVTSLFGLTGVGLLWIGRKFYAASHAH
ncbi:MAG: MFS transporter, partial [Alphaproteobacteria bacterium]|nr:MFS transporter [Alphaproteobacteria bacterium]